MPTQSKHASIKHRAYSGTRSFNDTISPYFESSQYYRSTMAKLSAYWPENGTLDFQDLANKACILRPSLTGILTRLEKAGMAVRLKPSNDQRRVFLKLTQEGEKLYQSIGEKVDERYDAIENVFSKEKLEKLKELLTELAMIEKSLK